MHRRSRFGLAIAALVAAAGVARAGDPPPSGKPPPKPAPSAADARLPAGVRAERDVEIGKAGERVLRLDLYLPVKAPAKPLPVVLWVHGGGWVAGSKDPCPTVGMVQQGYATASVDYRLSWESPFPAQIEDVKAAVRWLRAHAAEKGLDADRIGACGASAGGHLVALLGTAGDAKDLEGQAGNASASSRVQAVCDLCGPTDLLQFDGHGSRIVASAPDSIVETLLGGPLSEKKDVAKQANPITYVTKDDPPFLILHGDMDDVVPLEQSRLLQAALEKAKVRSTLVVVHGANHGVGGPDVNAKIAAFFDKELKSAKVPAKDPAPAEPATAPVPAPGAPPPAMSGDGGGK